MELTLRTIMVLMILLIATLLFASIILGWNDDLNKWFKESFANLKGIVVKE